MRRFMSHWNAYEAIDANDWQRKVKQRKICDGEVSVAVQPNTEGARSSRALVRIGGRFLLPVGERRRLPFVAANELAAWRFCYFAQDKTECKQRVQWVLKINDV